MKHVKRFACCLLCCVMLLGFVSPPKSKAFLASGASVVLSAGLSVLCGYTMNWYTQKSEGHQIGNFCNDVYAALQPDIKAAYDNLKSYWNGTAGKIVLNAATLGMATASFLTGYKRGIQSVLANYLDTVVGFDGVSGNTAFSIGEDEVIYENVGYSTTTDATAISNYYNPFSFMQTWANLGSDEVMPFAYQNNGTPYYIFLTTGQLETGETVFQTYITKSILPHTSESLVLGSSYSKIDFSEYSTGIIRTSNTSGYRLFTNQVDAEHYATTNNTTAYFISESTYISVFPVEQDSFTLGNVKSVSNGTISTKSQNFRFYYTAKVLVPPSTTTTYNTQAIISYDADADKAVSGDSTIAIAVPPEPVNLSDESLAIITNAADSISISNGEWAKTVAENTAAINENTVTVQGIGEAILDLPNTIGEKIKALFVPTAAELAAALEAWTTFAQSKLGFLYDCWDLVQDFVGGIRNRLRTPNGYTFMFPGIYVPIRGTIYTIMERQAVSLDNAVMDILRPLFGTAVSVISCVGVVNYASSQLLRVISGLPLVKDDTMGEDSAPPPKRRYRR